MDELEQTTPQGEAAQETTQAAGEREAPPGGEGAAGPVGSAAPAAPAIPAAGGSDGPARGQRPDGLHQGQRAPAGGRTPEHLQGELREFLAAYPDVRGEDIPKAVWQAAIGGQNLTLAYALHENQALQRRLDALERQQSNAQRSTGSQARHSPGTVRDLIDQWWTGQ